MNPRPRRRTPIIFNETRGNADEIRARTSRAASSLHPRTTNASSERNMGEEGKKDGSVAEAFEEKMEEVVTDAKKETGGSSAGVLDPLWNGLETVKGAFSTVTDGVGKAWSTLGEWKDDGA